MTKRTLALTAVVLYILISGGTFVAAQQLLPKTQPSGGEKPSGFAKLISPLVPEAGKGKATVTADAPKTEACPLNGALYTKAEREAWESRTPLAVMIENHVDARPQSGLSNADVVFEAIAEGGITRFMGIFYCDVQASDTILAPVRSARTYFIDWASSYQNPLYVHVGGANTPGPSNALGQLEDYGWAGKNDMNQFSIGFPTFVRNYNRIQLSDGRDLATEHTMETSTERLWEYAKAKRNITAWTGAAKYEPWKFKDEAKEAGTTTKVSYEFWEGFKDFAVEWNYDPATRNYVRNLGGAPHIDLNNNQPLDVKNVVVMFTTEKGPINENKHMLYGTTGTGKALIFQDGKALEAQWRKATRTAPLVFTVGGKPVEFVRGAVWISNVATGTPVAY